MKNETDRLDEFEMKLAFQEDLIQKLDDALSDQQQTLLRLEGYFKHVSEQLEQLQAALSENDAPDPPPPHY